MQFCVAQFSACRGAQFAPPPTQWTYGWLSPAPGRGAALEPVMAATTTAEVNRLNGQGCQSPPTPQALKCQKNTACPAIFALETFCLLENLPSLSNSIFSCLQTGQQLQPPIGSVT